MPVDLRLLRYFATLGEELHFGRAAGRVYVSQPALSKQIRKLEDQLGFRLFERTQRAVRLTDAGRALLDQASRTLAEAARFDELAKRIARGEVGSLQLGFVGQAANELTPLITGSFARQRPDVTLEMRQYGSRDLSAGLRDGEVDLAIVRLPIQSDGLRFQPLFEEPRVAVLPADHPLAGAAVVSVRQLLDEPWIASASTDPEYRAFALALAHRDGRPPQIGAVFHSIDEYLEAVLMHRGVGLAPLSAARYYARPGITYVPTTDAEPSVAALAWRDQPSGLSPAARAFVELATAVAARRGPVPDP